MRKDIPQIQATDAIGIMNALLMNAFESGASDLHLVPERTHLTVRFRIDGRLEDARLIPILLHTELIARIKILAGLRTDEHAAAQDGRFRFRVREDGWMDVRVSIAPTYYGENAVLRLLALTAQLDTLAGLGLSAAHQGQLDSVLARPDGLILTTGPTGSGKTTTLYALLARIARRDVSVVTIEDPIEYSIDGVNQIQVQERTGLTLSVGLRSILRQDPDIIMVGEIRDTETARLATNAALTGHQVFSTLHTTDSIGAIMRLRDLGVEPYLIASTTSLVIAQRLARRICSVCVVPEPVNAGDTALLQALFQDIERTELVPDLLLRGKGCASCNGTGYKGRIGIYELLAVEGSLRDHIANGTENTQRLRKAETMVADGIDKMLDGLTTLSELMRLMHG